MTDLTIANPDQKLEPGTDLTAPKADAIVNLGRIGVLIEEIKGLMHQHAITYVEIGRRLIELRERAEHGQWIETLKRLGFAPRTAQGYMAVAAKVALLPTIKDMAEGNFKKVLTLIESTTEEDLAAIASGQCELTLDDADRMNVRQLKEALRKRTMAVDAIVTEETKTLRAEVAEALKRAETAEAQLAGDWQTATDTAKALRKSAGQLAEHAGTLTRMLDVLEEQPAREAMTAVETALAGSTSLLQDLWTQLQERSHNDWAED